MTRAERFEDIIAWQQARVLTREIYLLTRNRDLAHDWSDVGYVAAADFERIGTLLDEATRTLGALRRSLKARVTR